MTLNNLQWQGRTFTVDIGPQSTTVTLASGSALPVQTPSGTVSVTGSYSMPTRRPDLQPTSDKIRCQPVTASSHVSGDEPVAAVDGSPATPWTATAPQATLTAQLPSSTTIRSATVTRGSTASFSYSVETSIDGTTWHTVATSKATSKSGVDDFRFAPTQAAYVRLDFPGSTGAANPDIDEFAVG